MHSIDRHHHQVGDVVKFDDSNQQPNQAHGWGKCMENRETLDGKGRRVYVSSCMGATIPKGPTTTVTEGDLTYTYDNNNYGIEPRLIEAAARAFTRPTT